ncbi:MAG: hypothetical protein QW046_05440 [Candidatus Micrarchaeaceae archaeon]
MPFLSTAYWKSLKDILKQYVMHNNNKFDYDKEGNCKQKNVFADRIRYIGKKSNNLDDELVLSIDSEDYLKYEKLKEFYD